MLHDYWIALITASTSDVRFLTEKLVKHREHSRQASKAIWPGPTKETMSESLETQFERVRNELREKKAELSCLRQRVEDLDHATGPEERLARSLTEIESKIVQVDSALFHMEARSFANTPYSERLVRVGRELFAGRYHRHSNGLASVVRDLCRR